MGKKGAKARPVMEIRISGLKESSYPFSFEAAPSDIGLDERFVGNVTVSGIVQKVVNQFFLSGEVSAHMAGECDRCLAQAEKELRFRVEINYHATDSERVSRQPGDKDDTEMRIISPDDSVIVLDNDIRQGAVLEVPLKFLCRNDCKGLCPACGKDLNEGECFCKQQAIDPRWEKLKGLFGDKEEN